MMHERPCPCHMHGKHKNGPAVRAGPHSPAPVVPRCFSRCWGCRGESRLLPALSELTVCWGVGARIGTSRQD